MRERCFLPTAPNGAPAGLGWQWKQLDGCLCLCLADANAYAMLMYAFKLPCHPRGEGFGGAL